MKKMKLIPFLAVLFMLNLVSCSSDGDTNYNTAVTPTPTQVVNNINNGSWRVLIYSENGTVNTAQFSGYNFTGLNEIFWIILILKGFNIKYLLFQEKFVLNP